MDDIYREQIMERYKHPSHKHKVVNPDISKEDSNPLCGDVIEVQVKLKDGKIVDAGFDGKGCVISQASADILLDEVKGKTLKEIQDMAREDMLDLLGINLTTSRVKCAMLALTAMKKGIIETEAKK